MRKKKKDELESALDDPLFYIPLIGPILHELTSWEEEDEWEEDDEEE